MNCKPEDLAIVVRANADAEHLIGRIVTVGKPGPARGGLPHWQTVPPIFDPKDGLEWVFADLQLRSIRDPGDDAVDESLQWLPATKQTESA